MNTHLYPDQRWSTGFRTGFQTALGSLAHRVEQGTFNPQVPGSSPGRPTSSEQDSGTPPVGRDRQAFPMFSHQRAVSPTGLPRRRRLRHVPGPRQSARRRPV